MAQTAGYNGKIYYAADSGGSPGTFYDLKMNSASIKKMIDALDVTNFASGGYKARIAGLKDTTPAGGGDYDAADTNGQVAMRTAIEGGTAFWLKVLPDGTNGWSVPVLGTDYTVESKVADKVTFAFTVVGNGAPTKVGSP